MSFEQSWATKNNDKKVNTLSLGYNLLVYEVQIFFDINKAT
jgi:hypothetical protein